MAGSQQRRDASKQRTFLTRVKRRAIRRASHSCSQFGLHAKVLMKMHRIGITMLLLVWAALCSASELPAADEAFAPGTVGQWQGQARIIVAWAKQTNLWVALEIRDNGAVTGRIGDALLLNGRLKKNRGEPGRKLKLKTDYIVVGDLKGAIISAEGITRAHVKLPLNLSDGILRGGLHTCGSKFGGKDQMILTAAGLMLTRVAGR
jgi:hypothetical protein